MMKRILILTCIILTGCSSEIEDPVQMFNMDEFKNTLWLEKTTVPNPDFFIDESTYTFICFDETGVTGFSGRIGASHTGRYMVIPDGDYKTTTNAWWYNGNIVQFELRFRISDIYITSARMDGEILVCTDRNIERKYIKVWNNFVFSDTRLITTDSMGSAGPFGTL